MKKRIIVIAIVLVALVGGLMLFGNKAFSQGPKNENGKITTAAAANKISVQAQQANTVEKTGNMSFKATLEASEEGIVSSKVGGKVVQVLFDNGKTVAQGDPLVIVDDQDLKNQLKAYEIQLAASQASMQKLQANLENSQRNYNRTKALVELGADTKSSMEAADMSLKMAKADIEAFNANILSAMVSIEITKNSLANTVIRAPIGGLADERSVSLGQFISPGMELGKVKNISIINAVIEIDQSCVNAVKVGQKAQVRIDGDPNAYEGTVKSINVSADPSARVFKCKIQMENKDQTLRPGVFAKVAIINDQKVEMVAVPINALAGNEGGYYVFVNENGVAHKRSVTIGETFKQMVEIKTGVNKGESIICTNVSTLQDGDAVAVVSE